MLADSNNQIEDAARPLLENYFERIYRTRDDEFGNARDVRNFFDTVIKQKINRLGSIEEYNPQDFILTKEDIQAAIDKLLGKLNEAEAPAIEQLQAMTGLSRVKEEVTELNQMAIYQKCAGSAACFWMSRPRCTWYSAATPAPAKPPSPG